MRKKRSFQLPEWRVPGADSDVIGEMQRVETMRLMGMSERDICDYLGMSERQLDLLYFAWLVWDSGYGRAPWRPYRYLVKAKLWH